jgi:hypothetical protein
VEPLWQHMLHPATGARLALLGLPWKVVPFPLAELQSKLLARCAPAPAALERGWPAAMLAGPCSVVDAARPRRPGDCLKPRALGCHKTWTGCCMMRYWSSCAGVAADLAAGLHLLLWLT